MARIKPTPVVAEVVQHVVASYSSEYLEFRSIQASPRIGYVDIAVSPQKGRLSATACLGYRRSLDFDASNLPGQDFAAVRASSEYLVGVVADGVSRSFYGHLAAQHVSMGLLHTLWNERQHPPDATELSSVLRDFERPLCKAVESYQIPEHLPQLQRNVLENRRPKGSQSVFAAFIADLENSVFTLYQVGDVDAVVHAYDQENGHLIRSPKEGRWSSHGETELLMKRSVLQNVQALVIKSDGAGSAWGCDRNPPTLDEVAFERMARESAQADDVSFVAGVIPKVPDGSNVNRAVTYATRVTSSGSTSPAAESYAPGQSGTEESRFPVRLRLAGRYLRILLQVLGCIYLVLLIWPALRPVQTAFQHLSRGPTKGAQPSQVVQSDTRDVKKQPEQAVVPLTRPRVAKPGAPSASAGAQPIPVVLLFEEAAQQAFLQRHAAAIAASPDLQTKPASALVFITSAVPDVDRVEFATSDGGKGARTTVLLHASDGGQRVGLGALAQLKAGEKTQVRCRALDHKGGQLVAARLLMVTRQSLQVPSEGSKSLGYYEMRFKPKTTK